MLEREKPANHDREVFVIRMFSCRGRVKTIKKEATSLIERIWLSSAQVIAQKRVVFLQNR